MQMPLVLPYLKPVSTKSPGEQPEQLKSGAGTRDCLLGLLRVQLLSTKLKLAKWHRTDTESLWSSVSHALHEMESFILFGHEV